MPPRRTCCQQLNLKQADAVKFYTTIDEATGYDDSLSTVYNAIQDSGLSAYAGDPKTVATLFAPTDDVRGRQQQQQQWQSRAALAACAEFAGQQR